MTSCTYDVLSGALSLLAGCSLHMLTPASCFLVGKKEERDFQPYEQCWLTSATFKFVATAPAHAALEVFDFEF